MSTFWGFSWFGLRLVMGMSFPGGNEGFASAEATMAFRKESRAHLGRCAGSRTAHDIARTPSDTVRENSVFRLA